MANLGDDLLEAIQRISALDTRLRADTWRCHQEIVRINEATARGEPLGLAETEFWLRTFLRVFFAQVEGLSFAMREATVFLAKQGHVKLVAGAIAVLEEKRYKSRNGKIEEADAFNPTLENFLLAFHYFPIAFGVSYTVAKSDGRWASFTRSLTLRNSLMHPKRPEDLGLTAASIREFAHAFKWFTEQVTGCFGAVRSAFDRASEEVL